ncbi:MAG TPA: hypothetical protein VJB39_03180 [Patescibacteria group bacterium]|nr:hypothetical protein [Patescibacteria group bacterium]
MTPSKSLAGVRKHQIKLQPNYQNIIIVFAVLAFILIAVILYFSLSQATVTITPDFRQQQIGFAVQLVDKNKITSQDNLVEKLPGEILETAVEQTLAFEVEPYDEKQAKAAGEVTIINNYSKSQKLVAGTRLLTADNKLYRITDFVEVPAAGRVKVNAVADSAGEEFEIGPAKLTIPGLWEPLRDKIYAETGGFARQTVNKYQISQAAIDRARTVLVNKLTEEAKAEFSGLTDSPALSDSSLIVETIKYSTDAVVGAEVKNFSMTLGLGIKAVIFDQDKLKKLAEASLPDSYQTDNTLLKIQPDSFTYEITLLDANPENLLAQVKGDYLINIASLNLEKSELTGKSKKEAETYLNSLSDVRQADVSLPFWTKYLPAMEDKINVKIEQ